ncbi:MAG: flagellar basal body protein [Desulfobacterales bacterium]|nr:flagellar basal body protein [Desulfobacterales bacterium]
MLSSISSSLSALNAFGTKMAVSANNVANIESEGFKKSRADLTEGVNSTVEVEVTQIDSPGNIIFEPDNTGQMVEKELSNVDLTEEIPQTMIAQRGYEANLKYIKIQDELIGSVIDILG